jgi:adenine deaminase
MRTLLVVLVVGLLLVGESTWGAGTVAATPEADLVLLHGKVITVDSKDTIAQAVAVKDGKIVGVGRNEDVRAFIGSQTNVLDLKGEPLRLAWWIHTFM